MVKFILIISWLATISLLVFTIAGCGKSYEQQLVENLDYEEYARKSNSRVRPNESRYNRNLRSNKTPIGNNTITMKSQIRSICAGNPSCIRRETEIANERYGFVDRIDDDGKTYYKEKDGEPNYRNTRRNDPNHWDIRDSNNKLIGGQRKTILDWEENNENRYKAEVRVEYDRVKNCVRRGGSNRSCERQHFRVKNCRRKNGVDWVRACL